MQALDSGAWLKKNKPKNQTPVPKPNKQDCNVRGKQQVLYNVTEEAIFCLSKNFRDGGSDSTARHKRSSAQARMALALSILLLCLGQSGLMLFHLSEPAQIHTAWVLCNPQRCQYRGLMMILMLLNM